MPTLQFATSTQEAKRLSLLYKKGVLHRIRRGIYIDTEDKNEITKTLESKWPQIASYVFDDPIAIARTAAEGRPAGGRVYLLTDKVTTTRVVEVGHLKLNIDPGNNSLAVDPFALDLRRSNQARYLLEKNSWLKVGRKRFSQNYWVAG